jgi:hypothetical protein
MSPNSADLSNNRNSKLKEPLSAKFATQFRSIIGGCMYLAKSTRPDILFATSSLSRHSSHPTTGHLEDAYRILHYLAGTPTQGLTLHSENGIKLYATCDATHATTTDLHSIYGISIHIGQSSASILSISKKIALLTTSSTEAEYCAASEAAKEILWFRQFLADLGFPQEEATQLFNDNKSAITLVYNNGYKGRSKHYDIRYHFIRETVSLGSISVHHLSTKLMISDILTKPLDAASFLRLHPLLLGQSSIN